MNMTKFYATEWISGWIHIAEGIAILISLGFWRPCWSTRYSCWLFMTEDW